MSVPPRPATTVLYALVAFVFFVLVALVIWLAPLGVHEARRSWFFYKKRNNPPCQGMEPESCFPFALENCRPPRYYVSCHPKDGAWGERVCICGGIDGEGFV